MMIKITKNIRIDLKTCGIFPLDFCDTFYNSSEGLYQYIIY